MQHHARPSRQGCRPGIGLALTLSNGSTHKPPLDQFVGPRLASARARITPADMLSCHHRGWPSSHQPDGARQTLFALNRGTHAVSQARITVIDFALALGPIFIAICGVPLGSASLIGAHCTNLRSPTTHLGTTTSWSRAWQPLILAPLLVSEFCRTASSSRPIVQWRAWIRAREHTAVAPWQRLTSTISQRYRCH